MATESKLPPARPLSEFIGNVSLYSIPRINENQGLSKLTRRVKRNLLYFQTNYFSAMFSIFLIFGFRSPMRWLMGFGLLSVTAVLVSIVNMASRSGPHHLAAVPCVLTLSGLLVLYSFLGLIPSFLVTLGSVLIPVSAMLVHAAMRKQGIRNQLNWVTELVGLRHTVMAELLNALSASVDDIGKD